MLSREVKRNLKLVQKLTRGCETLLGKNKGTKCVIDEDGKHVMTRNGLHYLKAIKCKQWVYDELYDACFNFQERFGFGSEEFLVCVGLWSQFLLDLTSEGIPSDVLSLTTLEILHGSFNEMDSTQPSQTVMSLLQEKPNKQTTARTTKVNFSRYSRHVMREITQEEDRTKKNMEIFGRMLANLVDESDSEIKAIVLELLSKIEQDQTPETLSKLEINPDNVIVESSDVPPCFDKRLFDGVLVPCSGHGYFELMEKSNGSKASLNAILLNRIVYGDSFGDIKMKEVTRFHDSTTMESHLLNETDFSLLTEFDVKLIFYRGDLDTRLVQYCRDSEIHLIPVPDYDVMFRLHRLTGVSILFDIKSHFRRLDVANVEVDFQTVHFNVQPVGKRVPKEKPICGYINVRNSNLDRFYSIFLSSRGRDLQFLNGEKFYSVLKRVSYLLKSKTVSRVCVEKRLVTKLEKQESLEKLEIYEILPWLVNDSCLFSKMIKEQVIGMAQKYMNLVNNDDDDDGTGCIDCVEYKRILWTNSFDFVDRVLTTIYIDSNTV